ncbi:MAG TPA: hypothetical protein VFQ39_05025, partial [Longimicrobium sp.]|nr:hypothetical protein [Longimicrobium sp.]
FQQARGLAAWPTAAPQDARDGWASLALTDRLDEPALAARRDLGTKLWPHLAALSGDGQAVAHEVFFHVPMELARALQRAGEFVAALDWYQTVYAYQLPVKLSAEERKVYPRLRAERNAAPDVSRGVFWLLDLEPHAIAAKRPNPYTRFALLSLSECLLDFADGEFARETEESVATARSLYLIARELLALPELATIEPTAVGQVLLPNPRLDGLRRQAEAQLAKLRQGRNAAGLRRTLPAETAPLSAMGPGGGLRAPGEALLRPTPYRFGVLLERAKQLTALAQQVESAYLQAIEKKEGEDYAAFRAGQDLELAGAGVELQARRVDEARGARKMAELQEEKADLVMKHYIKLSFDGLSGAEARMLKMARSNVRHQNVMKEMRIYASGIQAYASLFGYGGSPVSAFTGLAEAFNSDAPQAAEMQYLSMKAGFDRRAEEWWFQRGVAIQERQISRQGTRMADEHLAVAEQEEEIARLQQRHARETADYLANRFLNAELYEWMAGVLGGVYRFFLQQATATARLAEAQLVFERQQRTEGIVRSDYWLPADEAGVDRRGLTGSARLLQDVQRLDQAAFEGDRRRLNLSQTFSLAEIAPVELQRFRETGVLRFATPMRLFDTAFPGHYLRLVRRVRTSVVALVPPATGIRATLSSSGISRVVVDDGGSFREMVVRRDPERVALTSTQAATGVFDLDTQAEMLLPFESAGVDAAWELEMPKAANAFDFGTIADVLLTVEYTALHSVEHRERVVKLLGRTARSERAFSLRDHFPDLWFELLNPVDASLPLSFTLRREDFPPHLERLAVESLVLMFAPAAAKAPPVVVADLRSPAQLGRAVEIAGQSLAGSDVAKDQTFDGVISTRRPGGSGWKANTGTPLGEWRIKVSDPATRKALQDGLFDDVILVVGYNAETPAWP